MFDLFMVLMLLGFLYGVVAVVWAIYSQIREHFDPWYRRRETWDQ